MGKLDLRHGDCLAILRSMPESSVQCCVTSPPYWGLRDYGSDGQLGAEKSPEEYVSGMVKVFSEVRRVLKDDGTLWLNLGDSYSVTSHAKQSGGVCARGQSDLKRGGGVTKCPAGFKNKDLVGIPWMVAFALRSDGWYLRSDIIWSKPNPMPESVTDRPTKSHEYIFLLSKSARYFYDAQSIHEQALEPKGPGNKRQTRMPPGFDTGENGNTRGRLHLIGPRLTRNKRTVWTVPTSPFKDAHFATYPPRLIRPCILAGSKPGDLILDPFNGAGTTGLVSLQLNRRYVGIDINQDYLDISKKRLALIQGEMLFQGAAQ